MHTREISDIIVRIAGISFYDRQKTIKLAKRGDAVLLEMEPTNPHDPNAIKVVHGPTGAQLGYIPMALSDLVTRTIVKGKLKSRGTIPSKGRARGSKNIGASIILKA